MMTHRDPLPGDGPTVNRGGDRDGRGDVWPMPQPSVVVVLYDSAEVIDGCLASLPADVELILVDNSSADDGLARGRAARPDAILIRSERNLGFGGGCNLGWQAARRPHVAFVNPDVRVEPDTLSILVRRLAEEPHGVIGPALLDASGQPRPCKRRSSVLLDMCGLLPAAARWAPPGWDGKLDREDKIHAEGGPVASVEGACFVVSRHDLEALGGFDEDFFLYYEEESLAFRLATRGGRAIYEPGATAMHTGAASTGKVAGVATYHLHRSRVIFYRKRDGNIRGLFAGLLLTFGALLSTASSAVNCVLRRRHHTTPLTSLLVLRGLLAGMSARLHGKPSYPSGGRLVRSGRAPERVSARRL